MVTNDATILQVKHDVNYEVAKLAWEGRLEEERDEIAYRMIPGPQAQYRCCIYKEREIINQRVRLAEGRAPKHVHSKNVIQVISAACEECPIASYIVTDNCRKCMGKACMNSCNFGAISIGAHRAYIEPNQCRECGKCAQACPYNAIAHLERPCKKVCPADAISYDEYGICIINEEKCIHCGLCVHSCPFGALSTKTSLVEVINEIKIGKKVIAMIAPATEGQFGADITMASWENALKAIGFADVECVSVGADMTAVAEAKEWMESYEAGEKKTTSCCPAFVNLIQKHYPELKDHISQTISPMCATSRMIKQRDPYTTTVFIGPCMAKKSEITDFNIEGNADYVLTYGEIRAMMRAKGVQLEPAESLKQHGSVYGKRFAEAGGVTNAVLQSMHEMGFDAEPDVCRCNGAAECKKALALLKAGKLPADFIEGMICEGGCMGGPSKNMTVAESKKHRNLMLSKADDRKITENIANLKVDTINMIK